MGGNVIHRWRTRPGPAMSANTTSSPGASSLFGAPLRPPCVLPAAPFAPVGFSKEMVRISCARSMRAGSASHILRAWHGRLLPAREVYAGRAPTLYSASEFAVVGFRQALAAEAEPRGTGVALPVTSRPGRPE